MCVQRFIFISPGVLDNKPEQTRNKLHMFLKQQRKTYQKSSKIRLY